MRHMRIMRQFGRTAEKICFVGISAYKTNFRGYVLAILPHKSSYSSYKCESMRGAARIDAKT